MDMEKELETQLESDHDAMQELMKKNSELLAENNKILKKIHRNGVLSFWLRILWFAVIVGLPFALYFYVLEPYFTAFGSSYETFINGINELPGLRGIDKLINR